MAYIKGGYNMNIDEIKEVLMAYYDIEDEDDYDFECGCYINGKWLSLKDIIDIIERNM